MGINGDEKSSRHLKMGNDREHKDRDDCDNGDRDGKPNPTLHLYK